MKIFKKLVGWFCFAIAFTIVIASLLMVSEPPMTNFLDVFLDASKVTAGLYVTGLLVWLGATLLELE
jgi:hypothetical protein